MKLPFSKRPGGDDSGPVQPADLAAQFRTLWTVSQFFSVLQRLQLQPERGRPVELRDLGRRIEEARQIKRVGSLAKLAALQRELGTARIDLYELDETVPVHIMRRFFERLGRFERAALGEVLRYYIAKPVRSDDDRDKTDLLVTRYGSYRVESASGAPYWRSIDGLGSHLERLRGPGDELSATARDAALEELRELRRAVFDVNSFGELIERKLVTRIRDFKVALGDRFFAPSILAEIVETNVAVHNKFQELYQTEMLRLQLESERIARLQEDVGRLLPSLDGHHALSELATMAMRMQQILQEVKKEIAEHVIVDRNLRVTVEKESVPLRTLVDSCEEALRQTSDIVKSLHGAYQKAELGSVATNR
jgi:cell fate (sporulation/competence/biofilm development) regulator YlbF (YheA/YmcA/DUF963 family)